MVLTRRAATEQNSISRWLPNEVLAAVMTYCSEADLVALCKTSRLLRNLARPVLYRSISIGTTAQMKAFLRTMKSIRPTSSTPRLSDHVRQFVVTDRQCTRNLPKRTAEFLSSLIPKFHHLQSLDLGFNKSLEFTEMLERASFSNLSNFSYTVPSHNLTLVPSFLNRHSTTIKDLSLISDAHPNSVPHLDTVHLPRLKSYDGPSFFIRFFDTSTTCSVTTVFLWFRPYDRDIDRALMLLGPMTALHSFFAFGIPDDIPETTVLESVAKHIPRIQTVALRKDGANQISYPNALEIAPCLKKLKYLHSFNIGDDDGEDYDDLETVYLWSGACSTLSSIVVRTWAPAVTMILVKLS
ncbi:hypothetical protein MSAN_02018200 [Mycena sanguinolenta]|uniref:F-box domain-containing protein n=1 Tax=Mycena sanguinolenta TaxID=230812 RepID=A0A8H6XL28_9AGAR|nr:hypothetical protein MSAN_02018200 [Mycena sanguinolenta]